jgi:hypothetical protein
MERCAAGAFEVTVAGRFAPRKYQTPATTIRISNAAVAASGAMVERLDLAVSDLGAIQLKNIADPVRAYSLEVGKPAQVKPATEAQTPKEPKPTDVKKR